MPHACQLWLKLFGPFAPDNVEQGRSVLELHSQCLTRGGTKSQLERSEGIKMSEPVILVAIVVPALVSLAVVAIAHHATSYWRAEVRVDRAKFEASTMPEHQAPKSRRRKAS
jgi:hypothetical protein